MTAPNDTQRSQMLKTVTWSEHFTDAEIEAISEHLQVRTHPKGDTVFLQGDPGDFLCFLVSGSVGIAKDVTDTRDHIVVTIKPGTHFGELSFADGKPRSASAIANEDSVLLILTREGFDALAAEHPHLGIKVLQHMLHLVSTRLRLTTRELVYRV